MASNDRTSQPMGMTMSPPMGMTMDTDGDHAQRMAKMEAAVRAQMHGSSKSGKSSKKS